MWSPNFTTTSLFTQEYQNICTQTASTCSECCCKIGDWLKKVDHITPAMKEFHLLSIEKRVIFRCLLIAYKALIGTGPSYIREMLPPANVKREALRSSDDPLCLEESRMRLITYEDRAFSVAAESMEWFATGHPYVQHCGYMYFKTETAFLRNCVWINWSLLQYSAHEH